MEESGDNALSSLHKLLRNRPRGEGGGCSPPPPPINKFTRRFRNNQCKDDRVLLSHRLNMELDLQSAHELHVHTAVL
jgi:hypothetical protein